MVDEFMVTKKTLLTHAWSPLGINEAVDMKQLNDKPRTAIVAASRENGVELFMSFEMSVNKHKFKLFLEEMKDKWPDDKVTIVMDNLALHKCPPVKNKMMDLGYEWAWTPV